MSNAYLKILGRNIRRLREKVGLSQDGLAQCCGLHRTYIGGVERGERNLGLLNLIRIAEALDVPVTKLLADLHGEKAP